MSFGQEVKDFLNAYSAGQKIEASKTDQEYKNALTDAQKKKTDRDNDPETLSLQGEQSKANLDLTRQRIAASRAAQGYTAARTKLVNSGGVAGAPGVAPEDANIGGAVAAGAQPFTPAYANGGLVEDQGVDDNGVDEEDPNQGDASPVAVSDATARPQQGMTDVSSRSRTPQQPGSLQGISPALVHDAVKGGMTYGINAAGIGRGGVMTRAQQQKALAYARGFGALPPQELDKVKKAVDPDGKLSEAQRNMAALGAVFQYQMNRGNPEGAQRAAFQVLQAYRLDSMRYASIAAHAAENGNLDLAAQAAVKAYANIPDGNDIHLSKGDDGRIMFTYTDGATGKVIQKGLVTPQELAAQATGLAKSGFDKAILSAAGQREANEKGKSQGLKVNDVDKISTAAASAVDDGITSLGKEGEKISPESKRMLNGTTMRVLKNNVGGLTPAEAFVASRDLLGNTNNDAFKIKKGDDGENIITFGPKSSLGAGYSIKMDDASLEPIIAQRAALMASEKKKKDEGDKSSGKLAGAVDRFKKGFNAADEDIQGAVKVGDNAPALAEDAPLSRAGRAIGGAVDAVKGGLRRVGAVDTEPLDYQGAQTP